MRTSWLLVLFVVILGAGLAIISCDNDDDDDASNGGDDDNISDDDNDDASSEGDDDDDANDDDVTDDDVPVDDDNDADDDDDDGPGPEEIWCNEIAALIVDTCDWTMPEDCYGSELTKDQIAYWCRNTNVYDPEDARDHFWRNIKLCAEDACDRTCFDQNLERITPYDPGSSAPQCARDIWRWHVACDWWFFICDNTCCYTEIPEYIYYACQGLDGEPPQDWSCEAYCGEQTSCEADPFNECMEDCEEPEPGDDDFA